jgi:type VI secretion system secreted protein VgrG
VINAPSRIVLNGGGSYIKIEGGDIEIGTSGAATFKGAMKELAGGASSSASPPLFPRPAQWTVDKGDMFFTLRSHDGRPLANKRYRACTGGQKIDGFTDVNGRTGLLMGHIDQYANFELVNESFDEHFILKDSRGAPIANMRYLIKSADGIELAGVTDSHGRTSAFVSDKIEGVQLLHVPIEDYPEAEGAN